MFHRSLVLIFTFLPFLWQACSENSKPRPEGYPRIEFPEEREFRRVDKGCPFSFEIPDDAVLTRETVKQKKGQDTDCWFDLIYPRYKAQLHLTYKSVDGDLDRLIAENHKLAYEHSVKARDIKPRSIRIDSNRIYGTEYRIEGDVATNLQFFITDSSEHFFRGSLYFISEPNEDSLRPVIEYIEKDLDHIYHSFRWKEKGKES